MAQRPALWREVARSMGVTEQEIEADPAGVEAAITGTLAYAVADFARACRDTYEAMTAALIRSWPRRPGPTGD